MERFGAGSERSALVVVRPADSDWLDLRREADHRARSQTLSQVTRIDSWFQRNLGAGQAAQIIDLGAGTGSNQAWLAPLLTGAQQWVLVDHDASLLEAATGTQPEQTVQTSRVLATAGTLPDLHVDPGPALITCTALLDVLTVREAELIAETIVSRGAAALLSLTVTGEVTLRPADPADIEIAAAFDAHQRRDNLLGPDGALALVTMLRERGAAAQIVQTDWELDADFSELMARYLRERVEDAVEHDGRVARSAHAWLQRRLAQLSQGELRVVVGHQDVVCVPDDYQSAQVG